jgi:hypothetical protein
MGNYSKDRMRLVGQGLTGGKIWYYNDTGTVATVADVAGFFQNAGDMGCDSGDLIIVQAVDNYANKQVHATSLATVQDTGSSQGTTGPATLIGDTG